MTYFEEYKICQVFFLQTQSTLSWISEYLCMTKLYFRAPWVPVGQLILIISSQSLCYQFSHGNTWDDNMLVFPSQTQPSDPFEEYMKNFLVKRSRIWYADEIENVWNIYLV